MPISSKSLLESRVYFCGIDQAIDDPSGLPILATVEVPVSGSAVKGGDLLVALGAVSILRLLRHSPDYVAPFMECVLVIGDALVNGIGGSDFRVRRRLIAEKGDTAMLLDKLGDSYTPFAAVNLAIPDLVESLPRRPEREVRLVLLSTRIGQRLWVRPEFGPGPANPITMIGAFCATVEALVRKSAFVRPLLAGAAGLCLLEYRWRDMGSPKDITPEVTRLLWTAASEVVHSPDPVQTFRAMA